MALNATIYKLTINLSDFNQSHFNTIPLTLALHPSENNSRMLARVLAFCFHAHEALEFTKGLSTPECPDIWQKNLHGDITKWLEVGEPSFEKIKKACRRAEEVWVYSFNTKSDIWWQQNGKHYSVLPAKVVQFDAKPLQEFSEGITRTMELTVSIVDNEITLTAPHMSSSLYFHVLQ